MKNFFKGIVGGIGNIVPGLSGSALLLILNVYKKCITSICELFKFKNIRKNIIFLMPIALGIIVGTVVFGNIIKFFLERFPFITSAAFFGFILGTLPLLFKEARKGKFKLKYMIPFFVTFILGFALLLLAKGEYEQLSHINFGQSILLGLILAGSTIIPGISGTVLLTMMGIYDVYLTAVARADILFLIPVFMGFIIGAAVFSFLINFLFKKYYSYTMYGIIGFVVATIPGVLRGKPDSLMIILLSIGIGFISFLLTFKITKIN